MARISKRRISIRMIIVIPSNFRGQIQLEDAVVSQATNRRILAENENSDASNKS